MERMVLHLGLVKVLKGGWTWEIHGIILQVIQNEGWITLDKIILWLSFQRSWRYWKGFFSHRYGEICHTQLERICFARYPIFNAFSWPGFSMAKHGPPNHRSFFFVQKRTQFHYFISCPMYVGLPFPKSFKACGRLTARKLFSRTPFL